jgi:hypothetical protein
MKKWSARQWVANEIQTLLENYARPTDKPDSFSRLICAETVIQNLQDGEYDDELKTDRRCYAVASEVSRVTEVLEREVKQAKAAAELCARYKGN